MYALAIRVRVGVAWGFGTVMIICPEIVRCSPSYEGLILFILQMGVLKKAASGVLAPWPCSHTPVHAPSVQVAAVFPSRGLRTGRTPFLNTPVFFLRFALRYPLAE